jgi:hypothetical protein
VHVILGVSGAMRDMKLFRQTTKELDRLIAAHPGEPVHFLADKGYIGDDGSPNIILHTPVSVPKQGVFTPMNTNIIAALPSKELSSKASLADLKINFRFLYADGICRTLTIA